MPRVSFVMPVYNGERFLRPAMESILRQTHSNLEFIIVNDGSPGLTTPVPSRRGSKTGAGSTPAA